VEKKMEWYEILGIIIVIIAGLLLILRVIGLI